MTLSSSSSQWPAKGVIRIHPVPSALPRLGDEPGSNRFDDPRPRTIDRFLMRYAATSVRGCLLELLAAFRPDPDAATREAIIDVEDPDLVAEPTSEAWQHLDDFLRGRQVARIGATRPHVVSMNDPELQQELDAEPAVRALLDAPEARDALLQRRGRRVRLDNAAVRLSSELGRYVTQACALALYDRDDRPDVIHYRSRHDDLEDCWAIYHHVEVTFSDPLPLSPRTVEHRVALQSVVDLWSLPLPPDWH